VRADGRPFAWRGITAFRLLEMEAAGRTGDVDTYLRWAAAQQLTVVRVLVMAKHLFELPPARGLAALDRFLSRAERQGMHVEVVALADTASYPIDLEAHVRSVGQIAATHPNAIVEIANEPYHHTQAEPVHQDKYLQALRRQIPAHVPVALGAAGYPELHAGGDFITVHFPRSSGQGGWAVVRDLRSGFDFLRKTRKPVINDEPIGAGQRFEPGRRDDNPERFRASALLAGLLGLQSTFHYEGGLQAKLPSGRELEAFKSWREGAVLAGAAPPRMPELMVAADAKSPVQVTGKFAGAFVVIDGTSARLLVFGSEGSVVSKWKDGWSMVRQTRWPASSFIEARQGTRAAPSRPRSRTAAGRE